MKKCSGDGKTLSLSAGKITSLFFQHRIQSILCLQKLIQIYLPERCFHLFSRHRWIRHFQVFFYRSLEQITVMSHQGDLIHQTGLFNLLNRYIIDLDLSRKCTILPCQKCRNGTFSTTGQTHQRDKFSGWYGQRNIP